MLANYETRKGHKFLFSAFDKVVNKIPDAHLICCGDGNINQKNKVDMIPAIRTILPQTSNETDLTNQLEIFNKDAAGFSFYNYSFMNYENLDWINKSLYKYKNI